MTFEQMKNEYMARYNTEAYANDEDNKKLLGLFEAASNLSDAAKREFVKAFDFDFALSGEMYLGGKRTAAINFPNLIAEAETVGIIIKTR